METKETTLVDLLATAPTAEADRWKDYFQDMNREARASIPDQGDPAKAINDTCTCALHFGLVLVHQNDNPLWRQLSNEEKEQVIRVNDSLRRILSTQKEGGMYAKFFAGAFAAR